MSGSRSKRLAGVLALAAAQGCTATETGNPVASTSLALSARSSAQDVGLGRQAQAALRVDEAWIVLDGVEFVQSADCDRGPSARGDIDGPIALDLVAPPEPFALALDATRYCRVRVRLQKAKDVQGAPDELEDRSIVLRGERADGVRFELRSRRNFDLDLRARGDGFELGALRGNLILAFDLATWLERVDLSASMANAGVGIAVDDDHDRDRLATFEDNVKRALELFRDHDRNDRLDDEDLADPLAGGD